MDDLAREIAAIRGELTPDWDDARSDRLFEGVGRLQRQRRARRAVGSTLAVAGALAAVVLYQSVPSSEHAGMLAGRDVPAADPELDSTNAPQPSAGEMRATRVHGGQRVRLADGSSARVVSVHGALDVVRNEPRRLELNLRAGSAHFEVVKDRERTFLVNAGRVQVAVIGTVFDVEQREARVRVAVTEGKVRVDTPAGTQYLVAGESAWFDAQGVRAPASPPPAAPVEQGEPLFDDTQTSARATSTASTTSTTSTMPRDTGLKPKRVAKDDKPVAKVSWRSLCQSGDYDVAYRMLEAGTAVEDDPAALMDAADAARLSNHPEASVVYLQRVLRDHQRSPVAPLAGFTLGRVLLERLGQPSEAAEAFALARRIAPQGSLAQDALAREVEAWSKAGNSHEAYQRAQLYVQLYPGGRRMRAVRLYGGLE